MTLYDVHVCRRMRIKYGKAEAAGPLQAATIADRRALKPIQD